MRRCTGGTGDEAVRQHTVPFRDGLAVERLSEDHDFNQQVDQRMKATWINATNIGQNRYLIIMQSLRLVTIVREAILKRRTYEN